MKILTNKKYNELEQNFVDLQLDLNDAKEQLFLYEQQAKTCFEEIEKMEKKIIDLEISLNESQQKETKKAKEVKNLKSLLTKNKIDYSNLYTKVKKNARKQQ